MTDRDDTISGQVRRFLKRQHDRSEQDTRDVTGRKRKLSPSSQSFVRQSRETLSKALGADDTGSFSVGIDQVTAGFAAQVREAHRAEVHEHLQAIDALKSEVEQLRCENESMRALAASDPEERVRIYAEEIARLRETLRKVRGR